jgi:hypothetical protein
MASGHLNLQPKRLGETCYPSQPFDFISSLQPGETISTQVVTASVYSGLDPSPASIISGAASVESTTQVWQLITGGVVGVIYKLLCTVTTSLGQTLQQAAFLAVIPDLT